MKKKKHITQMSKEEIRYLINRFRSTPKNKWKFNMYSQQRAINRGVDMAVFRSIWSNGFDLIEFHCHPIGDSRILVRSIKTDSQDGQVCAVFSLLRVEVVTVYRNWRKNKHKNLVLSEYDPYLDIMDTIKQHKTLLNGARNRL